MALDRYDAALVCTPDGVKIELLRHLLGNGKHVLVEKPLLAADTGALEELASLALKTGVTCYTAYNHRFEPAVAQMKAAIDAGALGTVYTARLFYGNGTARPVRDSAWRDQGAGVLPDLGSHLLDLTLYWFGQPETPFRVHSAKRFENRAFDHVTFGTSGTRALHMEVTLLSWRNDFHADVIGSAGSAHIRSLCKWGPSSFSLRTRKLPSGRPDEQETIVAQADPTWELEYRHFKELCKTGAGNIANDLWINDILQQLSAAALDTAAPRLLEASPAVTARR